MGKKKPPTKEELAFMGSMRDLGCIVCHKHYHRYSPAMFHHCKFNRGFGQKKNHKIGFGLCHRHHQDHGAGVSFHDGRLSWEDNFGREEDLFKYATDLLTKYLKTVSIKPIDSSF